MDYYSIEDSFWSDRLARHQLRGWYEEGIRTERALRRRLMRQNVGYRNFRTAAFAVRAFLLGMGEPLHPID